MQTARDNLLRQQAADRVNDEARLANDIQRQLPHLTRSQALREAAWLVHRHGVGLTVTYETHSVWAARKRTARLCTAHDQLSGGTCGNCLHRTDATWIIER